MQETLKDEVNKALALLENFSKMNTGANVTDRCAELPKHITSSALITVFDGELKCQKKVNK